MSIAGINGFKGRGLKLGVVESEPFRSDERLSGIVVLEVEDEGRNVLPSKFGDDRLGRLSLTRAGFPRNRDVRIRQVPAREIWVEPDFTRLSVRAGRRSKQGTRPNSLLLGLDARSRGRRPTRWSVSGRRNFSATRCRRRPARRDWSAAPWRRPRRTFGALARQLTSALFADRGLGCAARVDEFFVELMDTRGNAFLAILGDDGTIAERRSIDTEADVDEVAAHFGLHRTVQQTL